MRLVVLFQSLERTNGRIPSDHNLSLGKFRRRRIKHSTAELQSTMRAATMLIRYSIEPFSFVL